MKTKSYVVYTFAELTGAARDRAIADHKQFLSQEWDGDTTIEDAKQCLAFAGFKVDDIHFSGFWSQGDGACFTGSWQASDVDAAGMREQAPQDTELHRIADTLADIAKRFPLATFTVKHSGHYSHKYCTDFSVSICNPEGDEIESPDREAAEKSLIETARDAMEWIYRQLEKDYEWSTADAQAIESIEANTYEFTVDGKID